MYSHLYSLGKNAVSGYIFYVILWGFLLNLLCDFMRVTQPAVFASL